MHLRRLKQAFADPLTESPTEIHLPVKTGIVMHHTNLATALVIPVKTGIVKHLTNLATTLGLGKDGFSIGS